MRGLLLTITTLFLALQFLSAQQDSLLLESDEVLNTAPQSLQIRPYVSFGVGPMTYFGDMYRYPGSNAVMGNWGFNMGFGIKATDFLDVELFYNGGTVSYSENTISRHANFKSRIRSGGLLFIYNFENFFKQTPQLHPLLIVGVSNVEFNSKTDLTTASGTSYNYWMDGSIRNLPEDHIFAEFATELDRDNVFESDLRTVTREELGDYSLNSLAIPLGIGADITLDYGFSLRLSSIMNFTFTDNIDGISSSSSGIRNGDSQNDRYLYTSVTLTYDLASFNEFKDGYGGMYDGDTDDEDSDGVFDIIDNCPFTPEDVVVDEFGCPLDGDGDLVPDYKDLELNTAEGSFVDTNGVAYTDDDFYDLYMNYMDTIGDPANIIKTVYVSNEKPSSQQGSNRLKDDYYSIQVASSEKDLSIEQIGKILSISDVQVVNDTDQTYYLVGEYEALELAVEQKILLDVNGIDGEVVGFADNQMVAINEEAKAIEDEYRLEGGFGEGESLISKDVIYRVQIGAFKNPLSRNVFEGVNDLIILTGEDGLIRYLTGSYSTIEEAASRKIDVLLDGFEGSFIVAYKNGKRISLETAGIETAEVDDVPVNSMDKTKVKFKVQVGAYKEHIPADVMDKLISLGDVKTVRQGGLTRYLVGDYESLEEAEARKTELLSKGIDAFVVGSFNNKIITVQEAIQILE